MEHRYHLPQRWTILEFAPIAQSFIDAKAAIRTLQSMPYQRDWVEALQEAELRREVAGTSRIEGAVFTERELTEALKESPEQLRTRSQRQAHAAMQTYKWIATIPDDRPIDLDLIREIHRKLVTGADDDHCPPGELRKRDDNVTFGSPRHRGAEGGEECLRAMEGLVRAINGEFRKLDPLLRGHAAHYHLAAIHPFLDGNGRTARALEILLLQRAGLRDICFIAVSNHYYEEKTAYLASLNESQSSGHDLSPILNFCLRGLALQAERVQAEIKGHLEKVVFRQAAQNLFAKLSSPRRRLINQRQMMMLETLMDVGPIPLERLFAILADRAFANPAVPYFNLKNTSSAVVRDYLALEDIGAISKAAAQDRGHVVRINYDWPSAMTTPEMLAKIKRLPTAKSFPFRHKSASDVPAERFTRKVKK